MEDKVLIEIIKIISPYIVAILGILSPIITLKYINKEELKKYKKQANHNLILKINSKLISDLNELKQIIEKIVEKSDIYKNKLLSKIEEREQEYIEYVGNLAIHYDDNIRNLIYFIKKKVDNNTMYLNNDIIKNLKTITDIADSPMYIFNWGIPVMGIRKDKSKIASECIKYIFTEGGEYFKPFLINIDALIQDLKYEIIGEK